MEEDIGKLDGILQGVQEILGDIKREIYGNGQPGIRKNLTIAQESLKILATNFTEEHNARVEQNEEIMAMIRSNTESIGKLTEAVNLHINDDEKHIAADKPVKTLRNLLLNKESLLYVVLGFLVLHSLAPSLDLVLLVKKIIGLP